MNARFMQIYEQLISLVPESVSLNSKEKKLIENIAELWEVNPRLAREIEDGVFMLIGRLTDAKEQG
jgi:hypothetical protein